MEVSVLKFQFRNLVYLDQDKFLGLTGITGTNTHIHLSCLLLRKYINTNALNKYLNTSYSA